MNNKKISILPILFIIASFLAVSCNKTTVKPGDLNNNIDSVSYAFGYLTGSQMESRGMTNLNLDYVVSGLRQALAGDTAFIDNTKMGALMRNYQVEAQARMMKKQMEAAKENQKKADEFLAQNKTKTGVQVTESGLQYKVVKEGTGASPVATDTVTVNYEGTLLNGEVFDSSYERGQPATFPLNRVIPGWTEGVQLMKVGGVYKFWVPPSLGYGTKVRPGGPIGPNDLLIFKVELIGINKK